MTSYNYTILLKIADEAGLTPEETAEAMVANVIQSAMEDPELMADLPQILVQFRLNCRAPGGEHDFIMFPRHLN